MKKGESTTCRFAADAVAWVFESLGGNAARRFERHRAACPTCAAAVAGHVDFVARLRALPGPQPSATLTGRIMGALALEDAAQQAPVRQRPPLRLHQSLGLATAACLLLALGLHWSGILGTARRPTAAPAGDPLAEAVDWLAAQQEADGSWLPSRTGGIDAYQPALTALATLALHSHAPQRHAAATQRGVAALQAMQAADGSFGTADGARLYNHAFATHALLMLHATVAPDDPLAATLQRAVAFARATQNSEGGWDYTAEGTGNTSLSVWQLTLLAEARTRGWPDEGGHLRRGLAWLRGRRGSEGGFGYRQPGIAPAGSDGMTLTAMAASTLLNAAHTYPELQPAAQAAAGLLHASDAEVAARSVDYYRDYFLVRLFDEAAQSGAAASVTAAVRARCRERPASAPWQGTDQWGKSGGDIYATAMALLTLQRPS